MNCPECNEPIISPSGDKSSGIALIGWCPEDEDIPAGLPFTSKAGTILRKEFAKHRVDFKRMYATYVWLHEPMKPASQKKIDVEVAENQNEKCLNYSLSKLINDCAEMKAILLVGADSTKYLTGESVSDWAGIVMQSDYFDTNVVMCMPKPDQVFSVPPGEVWLSVRKFVNQIRKRGFYK